MSKQQIRKIFNTTFYKRVKRSQRSFEDMKWNKLLKTIGEDELNCLFFGYPEDIK